MIERLGVQNEWRDKSKLAFAKLQKMLDPSFKFEFADPAGRHASPAPPPPPTPAPPAGWPGSPQAARRARAIRSRPIARPAAPNARSSSRPPTRQILYLSRKRAASAACRGAAAGPWQEAGQEHAKALDSGSRSNYTFALCAPARDTYVDARTKSNSSESHDNGSGMNRCWRSSMVEQLICNQQVAGSSPIASSVEQGI